MDYLDSGIKIAEACIPPAIPIFWEDEGARSEISTDTTGTRSVKGAHRGSCDEATRTGPSLRSSECVGGEESRIGAAANQDLRGFQEHRRDPYYRGRCHLCGYGA